MIVLGSRVQLLAFLGFHALSPVCLLEPSDPACLLAGREGHSHGMRAGSSGEAVSLGRGGQAGTLFPRAASVLVNLPSFHMYPWAGLWSYKVRFEKKLMS